MKHATKVLRYYLLGEPLLMSTDHKSLFQSLNIEYIKGQYHRWKKHLQLFNIKLKYKLGKFHIIPDVLSRHFEHRRDPSLIRVISTISNIQSVTK